MIADIGGSKQYLEAKGFAEVLGISAEITMIVSSSKYEDHINGKFLNLFYVGLRIQASYGNLANAHFVVEGWFKNDLFDRIATGVRDGLKRRVQEQGLRNINNISNCSLQYIVFHVECHHYQTFWTHRIC